MNKQVRVILSPEAEEVYKYLNDRAPTSKLERSILNAVKKKTELIKANIHYGDPISKDKIPEEYKLRYGVTNLFRVELPQFWKVRQIVWLQAKMNELGFTKMRSLRGRRSSARTAGVRAAAGASA